jgi:hypothetical protein
LSALFKRESNGLYGIAGRNHQRVRMRAELNASIIQYA